MRTIKLMPFSLLVLAMTTLGQAWAQDPIFPRAEKAKNVNHKGDIWLSHLSAADKDFDFNVAQAVNAPGARLNWHIHPKGQQLLITQGVGYYQERGKEVQVARKGDVIVCRPGVEHWHGASPNSSFTYLAISGNKPTKWLEEVGEADYNSIEAPKTGEATTQDIKQLSRDKWQWMADKDVEKLEKLFHPDAQFVHMGGAWGTERELAIIQSGGIWYKKADIHEAILNRIGDAAILLNWIDLLADVGGNAVINPFMSTEDSLLADEDF